MSSDIAKEVVEFVNSFFSLNTTLQAPEIVLIGRQGHGKSALLEAIVGQPFTLLGKEGIKDILITNSKFGSLSLT